MDPKPFEKEQSDGLDIIQELTLESFKEYKENKRNIEDFIQFLEALHYCEDPDELIEYEMPFSLN